MLQELCPRCGAEISASSCAACGFELLGPLVRTPGASRSASQRRRIELIATAAAFVGLVAISFGVGWRLAAMSLAAPGAPAQSAGSIDIGPPPAAAVGRVRFAERLGDSLQLESYRTQFTPDGTIAWRAELLEPAPTTEITVVIAWQSIRERMVLSRGTVALEDAHLTMIGVDEVRLSDLVPTSGLYAVSYFSGDTKLAEGVFEVLPPEH